jgi:hypothetical protein
MYRIVLAVVFLCFISTAPASAQERKTLFTLPNYVVTKTTPLVTTNLDVASYTDLELYFEFDTTTLDATPTVDILRYGFNTTELGFIAGKAGAASSEVGSSTVSIETLEEVVRLYFTAFSNATTSDSARLSNLRLSGVDIPEGVLNAETDAYAPRTGKIDICHFDNDTDLFSKESVNLMSIVQGAGHAKHGDDIIPPFWYKSREGVSVKFPGNDWNKTGKAIYAENCVAE